MKAQLKDWFNYVRKLETPVNSAYLQSLLITGSRREEMAGLKWADVDFRWHSMTIRDKVEGTRVIPLTPYLSFLIGSLPRRNEFVFSSVTSEDGKIVNARSAHLKACSAAGIDGLTLHGLRRSFKMLTETWVAVPVGVVAQIMGHKPSATAEKHYSHRPLDVLQKWHDEIEAWLLSEAAIEFSLDDSKIVRLASNV
jgi:integrase